MLEIGQVLSLKIRYNNDGLVADSKHPYLIVNIDCNGLCVVEIAQLDKIRGKEYKAYFKSNRIVKKDNEKVIDEDSFIQLDNQIQIEYFEELEKYRRQKDKLSEAKLQYIIEEYNKYHENNVIDDNKCVYMSKSEVLNLNS